MERKILHGVQEKVTCEKCASYSHKLRNKRLFVSHLNKHQFVLSVIEPFAVVLGKYTFSGYLGLWHAILIYRNLQRYSKMLQHMGLLFNLLSDKPVKSEHNDRMEVNKKCSTLTRIHLNEGKWCYFLDIDYLFLFVLKCA